MAFDTMLIMLSSGTGHPNRETRSEDLHRLENPLKNMQKDPMPSNFDRF